MAAEDSRSLRMTKTLECKCGGSGSYVVHHTYRDDDGTETGHSSSTHPCPCRSELPPRDGEASWWSSETVHKEVICDPLLTADIEVSAEVPYSKDNYRLHRHGRRYYPTMVQIQLHAGPLTVEAVGSLTDALNRATAVCAEIDDPDTAPCGHWAPCEDCEPERCGRIMVGSGGDTYDPTCDLAAGHSGFCKSYDATDQHKLSREATQEGENG